MGLKLHLEVVDGWADLLALSSVRRAVHRKSMRLMQDGMEQEFAETTERQELRDVLFSPAPVGTRPQSIQR
jgi:hypothetical protein